jgi:hypothetical protein
VAEIESPKEIESRKQIEIVTENAMGNDERTRPRNRR